MNPLLIAELMQGPKAFRLCEFRAPEFDEKLDGQMGFAGVCLYFWVSFGLLEQITAIAHVTHVDVATLLSLLRKTSCNIFPGTL